MHDLTCKISHDFGTISGVITHRLLYKIMCGDSRSYE